jgi:ribosomal protein L24E
MEQISPLLKCKYCGQEFEPLRNWQAFCNEKCRNNYHNDAKYRKKEDGSVPVIKCPHCTCTSFNMFDVVIKSPDGDTLYFCNVCTKEFLWESETKK